MKYLFSTLAILILYNSLFAQDDVKQFTRKTNASAVYQNGKWGANREGKNTFIINCNKDGDILWLTAQGEARYFKRVGGATEDQTDAGTKYQSVPIKDSKGYKLTFWLIDSPNNGIMLIWPSKANGSDLFMLYFFNSDDYEENE